MLLTSGSLYAALNISVAPAAVSGITVPGSREKVAAVAMWIMPDISVVDLVEIYFHEALQGEEGSTC